MKPMFWCYIGRVFLIQVCQPANEVSSDTRWNEIFNDTNILVKHIQSQVNVRAISLADETIPAVIIYSEEFSRNLHRCSFCYCYHYYCYYANCSSSSSFKTLLIKLQLDGAVQQLVQEQRVELSVIIITTDVSEAITTALVKGE